MALARGKLHLLTLLGCLATGPAYAGWVEGPYVVWVNLSSEKKAVDQIVQSFLDSGDPTCWNENAIMYMRSKPREISDAVVKRALIDGDDAEKRKVQRAMKKTFGEATHGFDGVVVYTDAPRRTILSMSRNSLKVRRDADIANVDQVPAALCNVMPEIERKP